MVEIDHDLLSKKYNLLLVEANYAASNMYISLSLERTTDTYIIKFDTMVLEEDEYDIKVPLRCIKSLNRLELTEAIGETCNRYKAYSDLLFVLCLFPEIIGFSDSHRLLRKVEVLTND